LARKEEFYLFKKGHVSPDTQSTLSALGMHRFREKSQHQDSGSLIGPGGNCLSLDESKSNELFVRNCAQEPKQRWQWSVAEGRLKYQAKPELCMGVSRRKNFEPLRALPCTGDETVWTFDRTAIHNYSEKCVDLLSGDQSPGADIGVWDCLQNNNQQWSITPAGEVRLLGLTGTKCWTLRSENPGAQLELYDCDGSPSQRFVFRDNKIRRGDKCLDLRPEKKLEPGKTLPRTPKNGWHVELWPCDDTKPNQEFHRSGPIAQKGKCIDSLHSKTTDGSTVGVYECIGNNNQMFDLHF